MKSYKYIHIFPNEKFIAPFIKLISDEFNASEHFFIFIEGKNVNDFPIDIRDNQLINKTLIDFLFNLKIINTVIENSEKIFIHGLFKWYFLLFLNYKKKVLSRTYWIIWGNDLYFYRQKHSFFASLKEFFRTNIIFNMGNLVTYIKGDYELAQKWYGASGKYHECFMYPSNLYKEYDIDGVENTTINIQVGNSADQSNNHLEVFEKLLQYKDENIKIYVVLSYGNEKYADEIETKGKELFGDKFVAMREFMPFDEYLRFLGKIDIAIFAHERQQAMGNAITLLGLGKKVYMRSNITPWKLFNDIDVKVYDVDIIELDLINKDTKNNNKERIKNYFSKENYLKQLKNLFGDENV